MKYLGIVVAALLFTNSISASAIYEPPSSQEVDLFNSLLDQFEKLDVPMKDVSDVIRTFQQPLIVSFACNANDTNNFVVTVVSTKLAKFDQTIIHQDFVTGGVYTWNCYITTEGGKITIQCNNELRLNPELLSNGTGLDPRVHQIENLVILYHELLHGQLMIDAIKSSSAWRQEVCNKPVNGTIDYSFADPNHKNINPLQTLFASELVELDGGKMITNEITPQETQNGAFSITILNLANYPQFANGAEVNLRGANIQNTKFSSAGSTVFLTGNLVNKTQSGTAWFYVFNNQTSGKSLNKSIPGWTKRTAGLWATGKAYDHDFYTVIQYLTQQQIVTTNNWKDLGKVPNWFKNNAYWWFEGAIDDTTFVKSVQYLISAGIIS
ncbi:MAG: hypothetical protein ACREAN_01495 [Nitrosopumilaceae archaeon]